MASVPTNPIFMVNAVLRHRFAVSAGDARFSWSA
jgi:hypothetical protein